ncbi:MAG: hypothetical protein J6127_05275 [Clostridiales bacterium]|nr:hypothetical protein [Clostridiales bacterium]
MFRKEDTVIDIIRIVCLVMAIALFLPAAVAKYGIIAYWSSIINTVPGVLALISIVVSFFVVDKENVVFSLVPIVSVVFSGLALIYKIDVFTDNMYEKYLSDDYFNRYEFTVVMGYGAYILILALIVMLLCTIYLAALRLASQKNY